MAQGSDPNETQSPSSELTIANSVRARPQMYIGSTDGRGLYNILHSVVDNSIEEVMNGFCSEVTITLHDKTTVTVEDNGRGIPVCKTSDASPSFLEQVMTSYDRDRSKRAFHICAGMHGLGLYGVNPLCSSLVADVHRDGTHYRMRFSCGVPLDGLETLGPSNRQGTAVTFTPDPDIFRSQACYLPELLCDYLNELACLNPEVTLRFRNLINGDSMTFCQPTGIRRLVEYHADLNAYSGDNTITYGCAEHEDVRAEIAFQQQKWGDCRVRTFMNSVELLGDVQTSFVPTALRIRWAYEPKWRPLAAPIADVMHPELQSGDGIIGFLSGVRRVLVRNAVAKGADARLLLRRFRSWDAVEGLNAVISLRLPRPNIGGPMHTRLMPCSTIRRVVEDLTVDVMSRFCEQNPDDAEQILNRIIGIKEGDCPGLAQDW